MGVFEGRGGAGQPAVRDGAGRRGRCCPPSPAPSPCPEADPPPGEVWSPGGEARSGGGQVWWQGVPGPPPAFPGREELSLRGRVRAAVLLRRGVRRGRQQGRVAPGGCRGRRPVGLKRFLAAGGAWRKAAGDWRIQQRWATLGGRGELRGAVWEGMARRRLCSLLALVSGVALYPPLMW